MLRKINLENEVKYNTEFDNDAFLQISDLLRREG